MKKLLILTVLLSIPVIATPKKISPTQKHTPRIHRTSHTAKKSKTPIGKIAWKRALAGFKFSQR